MKIDNDDKTVSDDGGSVPSSKHCIVPVVAGFQIRNWVIITSLIVAATATVLLFILLLFNSERTPMNVKIVVPKFEEETRSLAVCEGHCRNHEDCQQNLFCFGRTMCSAVPGCIGGNLDPTETNYCIDTGFLKVPFVTIVDRGDDDGKERLGLCQGDCGRNNVCQDGLHCYERQRFEGVPGCLGGDLDPSTNDYCAPSNFTSMEYVPGNLYTRKLGLLLSQGLDARLVATSGNFVEYHNGTLSKELFHGRPDAGATFPDNREHNQGGWIYVSNAEMEDKSEGGVGALTFDAQGNVIDYKRVLTNTTVNCGGGRTPWGSWISCEEDYHRQGHVYQVDPTGELPPEKIVLGSEGGRWESFAYDDRDRAMPHFFITEDHERGALARYTPSDPDWSDPWSMLHDESGTKDYLILNFETPDAGTFHWTNDRQEAGKNARQNYPNSEGIDRRGPELLFVCKEIRMMYTLQLDQGTFHRSSTVSGLFDEQPDQVQRLLHSSKDLLYFTEDGDRNAGVHARDGSARFYTILESLTRPGETTGLAFSPDGKFMYVAYQSDGALFCIWRRDGKSFGAEQVDIKYHEVLP